MAQLISVVANPSPFASMLTSIQISNDSFDPCSLTMLYLVPNHLPDEWLLLLDESITSACASLMIRSTSHIGGYFSALTATHAPLPPPPRPHSTASPPPPLLLHPPPSSTLESHLPKLSFTHPPPPTPPSPMFIASVPPRGAKQLYQEP